MTSRRLKLLRSLCAISVVAMVACAGSPARSNSASSAALNTTLSWIEVPTDNGLVRVAIARPEGPGPFPAILILHGTHGFAEEYVQLARDLARNGVLSFAACWFDRGSGSGLRFVTPIRCEGAPPLVDAAGSDRFRISRNTIEVILSTLRTRSDVKHGTFFLFGHSRGGGAALDFAMTHPESVSGVVLNSAGYPDEVIARAAVSLSSPALILHGDADDPRDGGSDMTTPARARRFEEALRSAGKDVEAKRYPGGHNSLFTDLSQYRDTVERIADFVNRRAAQ